MQRYLALRLLQSVLVLAAISLIVFLMGRATGNPLNVYLPDTATAADYERVAELWGFDEPLHEQYFVFIRNALSGEFGQSWRWPDQTALGIVLQRLPATVQLASFALLVSITIAVPIGVAAAVKRDSLFDKGVKIFALLGQSAPSFWLGIALIWIFAVYLNWVPSSGRGTLAHMILPAIAMGWYHVAAIMRLLRSAMLDALDSEYVKLARLKGLPEWKVVWKHSLKNAAIVPLTYFGIVVGVLMTGSVVTETVFSWPGVGLLAVDAIRGNDYQVIQAIIMVFAGMVVVINLLVDVLYAYIDPRIRAV